MTHSEQDLLPNRSHSGVIDSGHAKANSGGGDEPLDQACGHEYGVAWPSHGGGTWGTQGMSVVEHGLEVPVLDGAQREPTVFGRVLEWVAGDQLVWLYRETAERSTSHLAEDRAWCGEPVWRVVKRNQPLHNQAKHRRVNERR